MDESEKRELSKDTSCGFGSFRPHFLQRFATSKCFMFVYGILGTVQAMSYIYFVVSLTTMERRFKIQSKTTGIMLSGNEISQVTLSLFLSYFGGQRNRPKWISWGVCLCSLSCFILAMPHFLYGAGEDALALTKEYSDFYKNNLSNSTGQKKTSMCMAESIDDVCEEVDLFSEFSLLPAILVFISQFVLGIGNTLYYSLGNTYMDDNTKKTNTPMFLAYACALRTLGPVIGFILGPICLSIYIDPTLTPLIDKNDSRWLGAWWLGWVFMGLLMLIVSFVVGMFPRELPKRAPKDPEKDLPQHPKYVPKITEATEKDEIPLAKENAPHFSVCQMPNDIKKPNVIPEKKIEPDLTSDDFMQALKRISKNKLLMTNIFSTTFYILGASVFMTYMAKYIEVNYNRSAVSSTVVAGPAILLSVLCGFFASGWYISKKKPVPRRLLFWNVIVGCFYVCAQISYMFIGCPTSAMELELSGSNRPNLISSCNVDCHCEGMKFDPVCHKPTDRIFFSACHAGCKSQIENSMVYTNCSCLEEYPGIDSLGKYNLSMQISPLEVESGWNLLHSGSCSVQCAYAFYTFITISMIVNVLGSSSKIGNILVNYRCVEKRDKSFAQGMLLLIISLCALIPGPILYGAIIDSTCIEWGEKCGKRTNCLIYNKENFRMYINATAMCFTSVAVILDAVVWWLSKDLDLYSDDVETPAVAKEEADNAQIKK